MSIFFHAHWRSSSTYVFNHFREKELNTYCYYEPYNEILASISKETLDLHSSSSWDSGHPKSDIPYFKEFEPLFNEDEGVRLYKSSFSYENYFPKNVFPEDERQYLLQLDNHAKSMDKIPVYGFCRSLGRVAQIRSLLRGTHIMQYRNPHDMLNSVRNVRFHFLFFHILHHISPESIAGKLGFPFSQKYSDEIRHITSLSNSFGIVTKLDPLFFHALYFDFFVFTTISAAFYADMFLNVDRLSDSNYRNNFEEELFSRTNIRIKLREFNLHSKEKGLIYDPRLLEHAIERYIGTREKIAHFKHVLESVSGIPVTKSVSEIETLRTSFLDEYPSSAKNNDIIRAFSRSMDLYDNDVSKLASLSDFFNVFAKDAELAAKDAELAAKDAELAAKDAELEALYASQRWRITAPLRKLKATLKR